jgi:putative component of toxin-antitoxin plasmid stabilization module
MSLLDVQEYEDDEGRSPFAAWFAELDAIAAAKVTVAVAKIEQGNLSNAKGVGEGVLEHRIEMATFW